MELGYLDYAILTLALGGVIVGLFIGFSGALSFLVGTVVAGFAAKIGWVQAESLIPSGLYRGLALFICTLIVFWIVRAIVKKTIKLAVAQPGDSIFGALAAGIVAFGIGVAGAWLCGLIGISESPWHSAILEQVMVYAG